MELEAEHFVNLPVQISWQAQHCVHLHVQISWQAQRCTFTGDCVVQL